MRGRLAWCAFALLLGAATAFAKKKDEDDAPRAPRTADDLTAEQIASITRPPSDRPLPMTDGERLHFELGWSWFEVGEAVISLDRDDYAEEPVWHMQMVARTNGFADSIYKVRNTTDSWITPDFSHMVHYEAIQREGKREREVVVNIDQEAWTAQYHNRLNDDLRDPIAILEGTWDPMSITYYVRSIPLEVGQELIIPTTNGKHLYLTRVVVKKRVNKKFRSGRQDAFLVEPDIEDLGGVFRKSKNASVRFWFSADEQQLPLRMESEVSVGKFWSELTRVETVEPEPEENP